MVHFYIIIYTFIERDEIIDLEELIVRPERFYKKTDSTLDLICSHLGLINVDLELAAMLGGTAARRNEYYSLRVHSLLANGLNDLVKKNENQYDLIIIDCPPNFNIVTKNALVASDYYLIPAKPDFLSTLGIRQLDRHVRELVENYNGLAKEQEAASPISPKFLGVVFNMLTTWKGEPIATQKQYITQIKREKFPIFETKLRDYKSVYGGAGEHGIPVVAQPGTVYKEVRDELMCLTDEFLKRVALGG